MPDLLQRFAEVSDGRSDQGRAHPVAVVLSLCAAAVVAGMGSFFAIAGRVTDVPAELLAKLYGTTDHADPTKIAILVRNHWGIEVRREVALVE